MKRLLLIPMLVAPLLATAPDAGAQQLREGYIDWGVRGPEFPSRLKSWNRGDKWTADDNFFISRVKPHERFRNQASQVNKGFDETNDKNLIYWVPINNPDFNALPDGVYDSDVFTMWPYVTHYGDWSTSLVRIPGAFLDVAHKNGVAVSPVAGIPWGSINDTWKKALTDLTSTGAAKVAEFLDYYGIDGLGYNSEFQSTFQLVKDINAFHAELVRIMKQEKGNKIFENIWYDGTCETGAINFDKGLGTHNDDIWGYGDEIKTSLFFNYNWNKRMLLDKSVEHAQELGRSPLDLYAGINMQGGEPKSGERWTKLAQYPVSIGLWGAHSTSMMFESRAEKGTDPDTRQRTLMLRNERWFTGGTRNPANTPALNNSLSYSADNYEFPGMSKMMSARSALKWDLSQEPFYTAFNVGNGKFMNYKGIRQNNNEWYNIGIQDYLPTWRWWFASKFLGGKEEVPSKGLDAEFIWTDAWNGGSLMHIYGSTLKEYLHLFKTEFAISKGDVISITYKVNKGTVGSGWLALSAKGNEAKPIQEKALKFVTTDDLRTGMWRTVKFTVGDNLLSELAGKELAVVALGFDWATDLDISIGEFSITRGNATSAKPATPVIERAELLAANSRGADGKIIFNMPNDKGNDKCYNLDVKTSLFKLYARQEGKDPVMMGMTTSWAGIVFAAPFDPTASGKISFGVSAVSLDMSTESDIAWSESFDASQRYEMNDDITTDLGLINTNQAFTISYTDPMHEAGDWELTDATGKVVATSNGTTALECSGLSEAGTYTLRLTGMVAGTDGRETAIREYPDFVQVVDEKAGSVPEILTLAVQGHENEEVAETHQTFTANYTGKDSDGKLSRGVKIKSAGVGFNFNSSGIEWKKPFTVSFWFKPETFENEARCLFNIRDKGDSWPVNTWGIFWTCVNEKGEISDFSIRASKDYSIAYHFDNATLRPGIWSHVAYIFDFDDKGALLPSLYLNGRKCPLSSYTKGDETVSGDNIKYEDMSYTFRKDNVLTVGGVLHTIGSVYGNLDNLMVYSKALGDEEVKADMQGIDPKEAPESLVGLFDFEDNTGSDYNFVSKGKNQFSAGFADYRSGATEGQGILTWVKPEYCSGSPFVKGEAWPVVTDVNWSAPALDVDSREGNAEAGKAVLTLKDKGEQEITLTLSNEYGSDSRSVRVKTDGTLGIEGIGDTRGVTVGPALFDNCFYVTFDTEGAYTLTLVAADGIILTEKRVNVSAGESIRMDCAAAPGVVLLQVAHDDAKPVTLRLIKK